MRVHLLLRGARVFPGDGPAFQGDVAVTGDQITAIGEIPPEGAVRIVDAQGLMLCPGFIDMHAHSALEPFSDPLLSPKVAQGFTTELLHPDGLAPAPVAADRRADRRAYLRALEGAGPDEWTWSSFAEYLDALAATRPVTTLVPSVGHNAVRDYVMGSARRAPTQGEVREMQRQVSLAIDAGARSLSFGLIYLPGLFAAIDELVAVGEAAARAGIPLVPHIRNEGEGVLEAAREMIVVARRSGASLHISHLKVVGNRQLVEPLLELIETARKEIDLTFDQYPYGAGSTILSALLPNWAQDGGPPAILERASDPEARRAMLRDAESGLPGWENLYRACGPQGIVISDADPARGEAIGRSLLEIGEEQGTHPFEAALDLLRDTQLNVSMVDHYATEETVRTIFRHPAALVGSDGIFGTRPHPRVYGTAARVLGRYALREGLISVEEAVARLTARAADRLRLADRGRIRGGLRADLVLLDPGAYVDRATYEQPKQYPDGVRLVVIGGQVVWEGGAPTGVRPGAVLRTPV